MYLCRVKSDRQRKNGNMSGSIYAVSLEEEEASKLTKKEKRLKEEAKQARLKDRENLKKWTPIIYIVPFFWSVKCLITIFVGSLIFNLQKTGWACSQNLRGFISVQIVFSYWFMFIYTWLYIGPYPCKRLLPVAIALGLYTLGQFVAGIYGTVIFNLGFQDCRQRAPTMLYHTRFEVGTFWLAFACFCTYGIRYAWEKYEKKKNAQERANLSGKKNEDDGGSNDGNSDDGSDDAKKSSSSSEKKSKKNESESDEESEESDLS